MLEIGTDPKEKLNTSSAEMVYSTPFTIAREFFQSMKSYLDA